ncbi:MAG: hypothetical protein ACI945_000289 [Pseudohongiellaceae bacterium]|jgi:hypothetical protein
MYTSKVALVLAPTVFDTPDQLTLPILSTANSVSARIAYDDKYTVGFL